MDRCVSIAISPYRQPQDPVKANAHPYRSESPAARLESESVFARLDNYH